MLPRAEMFKEVIFIPRIIAFNESFVPVGSASWKSKPPTAVIWHEAIAGRKKEDLVSTFYEFFLTNRDFSKICLWLDNCAAQNKNWTLLCFFTYIVNCPEVTLEYLDVKYLESGHTFMSADAFHHQVELSLKRTGKVYDFNDFKSAVQKAGTSRVNVREMKIDNFLEWQDFTSQYKLKKIQPRPYLNSMVWIRFKRGFNSCWYKNNFEDEFRELNFLNAKQMKEGIEKPGCRVSCRGVREARKSNLLKALKPIIPKNRITFWETLPTNEQHDDDI